MKSRNNDVQLQIEKNKRLFTAIRRSDVALQVRSHMASKGIRNVDLAQRLSVSEANVSRWLKGNQNLSIDTLYLLADAIEEPLTVLVGRQEVSRVAGESGSRDDQSWRHVRMASGKVVNIATHAKYFAQRPPAIAEKFEPSPSLRTDGLDGEANERAAASA